MYTRRGLFIDKYPFRRMPVLKSYFLWYALILYTFQDLGTQRHQLSIIWQLVLDLPYMTQMVWFLCHLMVSFEPSMRIHSGLTYISGLPDALLSSRANELLIHDGRKTILNQLRTLDSCFRPGIPEADFWQLFVTCCCGLVTTRRAFRNHVCVVEEDPIIIDLTSDSDVVAGPVIIDLTTDSDDDVIDLTLDSDDD